MLLMKCLSLSEEKMAESLGGSDSQRRRSGVSEAKELDEKEHGSLCEQHCNFFSLGFSLVRV